MFDEWLKQVNAILYPTIGVGHTAFPHLPWHEMFTDRIPPDIAAQIAKAAFVIKTRKEQS